MVRTDRAGPGTRGQVLLVVVTQGYCRETDSGGFALTHFSPHPVYGKGLGPGGSVILFQPEVEEFGVGLQS